MSGSLKAQMEKSFRVSNWKRLPNSWLNWWFLIFFIVFDHANIQARMLVKTHNSPMPQNKIKDCYWKSIIFLLEYFLWTLLHCVPISCFQGELGPWIVLQYAEWLANLCSFARRRILVDNVWIPYPSCHLSNEVQTSKSRYWLQLQGHFYFGQIGMFVYK